MKAFKNFLYLLLIVFFFVSCDERDFDVPPISVPTYEGPAANISIKELKAKFNDLTPTEVKEALILKARVIGNDEAGNIFKQLYVQDSTGGILLSLDQSGVFALHRVGQEVYINLQGLYVGKYGGEHQIGTLYNGNIGRMSANDFKTHVSRNGLPRPDLVAPLLVTISDLAINSDSYVNTLIRVDNVSFVNGGVNIFAPQTVATAQEEPVKDLEGKTLSVRTSKYANFSSDVLPKGVGSIVGVLGRYNGNWQFTLRSRQDLIDFSDIKGTFTNPYNITEAIAKGAADGKWWSKGFIVGVVKDGINKDNPIKSNDDIITKGEYNEITIVLADKADEQDWKKCIVVNLPVNSDMRKVLNLRDNPRNLGQELLVQGQFTPYFGAAGIKVATGSKNEFSFEDKSSAGDGTKDKPYNFAQARASQGETGKWVKAYIVGAVDDKSLQADSKFVPPFKNAANVLLAATPNEKDPSNCIPVQLPFGDIRAALNLVDNVDNLGKEVLVLGNLVAYFGTPGIKETSDYVLVGGGEKPQPPVENGFFFETFGLGDYSVAANRKLIADFTDFDNKSPIKYSDASGKVDIRNLKGGTAHAWFPAKIDTYLTIEGINTAAYKNVKLSYEVAANLYDAGAVSNLKNMQVRCNGVELSVEDKPVSKDGGDNNKFYLLSVDMKDIASGPIKLEFFASGSNNLVGLRLDNIKLVGEKK